MTILNPLRFFKRILKTPDERSNRQRGRTEEESNPNETSDKTNKSTSKSSPTKSNKQKQQRFQEEIPSEGSNRQRGRAEEESDPNETSDKTNKSTSKSLLTKSNKQKQQRFQEETPDKGSNRQRGRTEEESNPNEMIDKTNKSTSKSSPIKSILKSAKLTKLTQEESDDEVIEIEPPNIPKDQQEMLSEMKKRYENIRIPQKFVLVVKDDQGNERMIDDDDTDLEAENLKLKKQIEEVQVENAKLQRENNQLFDENRFLTRINEAFADENDDLRKSLNRYSRIRLPKAIHRQTDLKQPAKRQKRIKTKKSEQYEEESEEERSGSNNNDEYDEKEARLKNLLRNVLNVHSSNKSKLIRERRYDDEVQKYDRPHLSNASEWSYIVQQEDLIFDTDIDQGLITEYDEEEEEVSRGTTPATGNTTENDEDHNKEGEEKPSKSTVGDNHNNSDSDLHMDDAQ
ncbi:unnamed protein product [Rhizophagus irregularis]|uniref:Uncharacterized protein n=1 Tax=Rhizophagus irregularis TaxID=588596 RepID=A0A915Z9E5_9GLOM|nr:unnamed protein product [Rhizophagus irregularis]